MVIIKTKSLSQKAIPQNIYAHTHIDMLLTYEEDMYIYILLHMIATIFNNSTKINDV